MLVPKPATTLTVKLQKVIYRLKIAREQETLVNANIRSSASSKGLSFFIKERTKTDSTQALTRPLCWHWYARARPPVPSPPPLPGGKRVPLLAVVGVWTNVPFHILTFKNNWSKMHRVEVNNPYPENSKRNAQLLLNMPMTCLLERRVQNKVAEGAR